LLTQSITCQYIQTSIQQL